MAAVFRDLRCRAVPSLILLAWLQRRGHFAALQT